jgi:hypothetical protein
MQPNQGIEFESPPPLGECAECHKPLWEGDPWGVDQEGAHWCIRCWPGGEGECFPGVES